jgi:hypothetical protein
MPANTGGGQQGPFEGSRCVAGPGGHWAPATVRRVNEDGTFKIEFDVKQMQIMPYWHGVTAAEVSFDDDRLWPRVLAEISPDGQKLTEPNFRDALTRLGYQVDAEQSRRYWGESCRKLFDVAEGQADGLALDPDASYRLFLHLGLSAKQCAEGLRADRPRPYYKLYWNQTRMGGREPAELPRRVTLDDALAALGLTAGEFDDAAADFVHGFEREQEVQLPTALKEFVCLRGVADAVTDCHPNNPNLDPVGVGVWHLQRGMRRRQLQGDYALVVMQPHQGDHQWAVVFDDGEDDARVYVWGATEESDYWLLTAPGIGMFFWDLAQTGLAWYQDTRFGGGRRVKRSDIGLVPDV